MQIPSGLATTGGSPKESEVAPVYHRLFCPDHYLSYFWQRRTGEYKPEGNLFPLQAVDDHDSTHRGIVQNRLLCNALKAEDAARPPWERVR